MNTSVETPILCPVLVGRAGELAMFGRLIAASSAGQGQIVLLGGEAGVGKSRLVAEVRERAAAEGFAVLQGRCFESDRALPYAALSDLLRDHFAGRTSAEQAAALGDAVPTLATLLPELTPYLPAHEPILPPDAEQARRQLFDALTRWLLVRGPTLVILEDLHWSDDTTLAFLPWFARHIGTRPLLVVLTYRSDEAHDPLRHMLATFDRMRLAVTEITLGRLERDGVQAMIGAIFAQRQPVRREFAETIHVLTDGNPFFVEEILKTMVAAGDIYQERGV